MLISFSMYAAYTTGQSGTNGHSIRTVEDDIWKYSTYSGEYSEHYLCHVNTDIRNTDVFSFQLEAR